MTRGSTLTTRVVLAASILLLAACSDSGDDDSAGGSTSAPTTVEAATTTTEAVEPAEAPASTAPPDTTIAEPEGPSTESLEAAAFFAVVRAQDPQPEGPCALPVALSVEAMVDGGEVPPTFESEFLPDVFLDLDIGPVNVASNANYCGDVSYVVGPMTSDEWLAQFIPPEYDGDIDLQTGEVGPYRGGEAYNFCIVGDDTLGSYCGAGWTDGTLWVGLARAFDADTPVDIDRGFPNQDALIEAFDSNLVALIDEFATTDPLTGELISAPAADDANDQGALEGEDGFALLVADVDALESLNVTYVDALTTAEAAFNDTRSPDETGEEFTANGQIWIDDVASIGDDYAERAGVVIVDIEQRPLQSAELVAIRDAAVAHYRTWIEFTGAFVDFANAFVFGDEVTDWDELQRQLLGEIDTQISDTWQTLCTALGDGQPDGATLPDQLEQECRNTESET
ncbi:MAG: hypothetical protein AAGA42_11180 [Actinomycetota bacterium]